MLSISRPRRGAIQNFQDGIGKAISPPGGFQNVEKVISKRPEKPMTDPPNPHHH